MTVEWQILNEDEPWEEQVAMPDCAPSAVFPARGRVHALRAMAGLLVVLVTSAAFFLWATAETGAQKLEDELRVVVAAEAGLPPRPRSDQDGRDLPVPAITLAATAQMQELTFHGNVASVEVESTTAEPDGRSYKMRQRHFYQSTASGWVRVSPNPSDWGARQSLETESFTFSYYELDSAAVEAVAATLDDLYSGLRQDYGLPPAVERVVVEMVSEPPPYAGVCRQRNRLCIQSPALVLRPQELSETKALHLMILSSLVYQVRRDALEIGPFRYGGWQMAASTLPRLQIREHSEFLSAWHRDLVRWLYDVQERTPRPDEQTLAEEFVRVCETHKIPALWPLIAEVPSTYLCVAPATMEMYHLTQPGPIFRLGQLSLLDQEQMVSETSWVQMLAFETLLDYVVVRYGRDALPTLVEGFRRYDTWSTLIPALFAISTEEFEIGWHAYLADHYRQDTR